MTDPTRTPAFKLGYARAWISRPFDAEDGPIYPPGSAEAKAYEQGYTEARLDIAAAHRREDQEPKT